MKYEYSDTYASLEPETKLVMGYRLGLVAQIGIGDMIAIQSGLEFSQKGSQDDFDAMGVSWTGYNKRIINYIDIPVYATITGQAKLLGDKNKIFILAQ